MDPPAIAVVGIYSPDQIGVVYLVRVVTVPEEQAMKAVVGRRRVGLSGLDLRLGLVSAQAR